MSSMKNKVDKFRVFKNRLLATLTKNMISREFVRFVFVGAFATLLHYLIYSCLIKFINLSIAFSIGYLISFCCNFWLTTKFTFKTDATAKRGLGFAISHLINYGLQMLVLNISVRLGIPDQFAPIPVYLICIPVNFLLVRFVFKKI